MTISISLAMIALIASLAALCAAITAALRQQPALIWLAAGLSIGILESVALQDGNISMLGRVLITFSIPSSFVCVGQAVRLAIGKPRSGALHFGAVATMIAISLIMLAADAPAIWQMLGCQLAGLWALIDMTSCAARARRRGAVIDTLQLAVLGCVTLVFLLRIPVFPILIDQHAPFMPLDRANLQALMITLFGVLVPACVTLVLARVIIDAVDIQRQRAELDYLTGLPNRRAFEDYAGEDCGVSGTLLMCDIDQFKRINDRFGHQAGDTVIRAFAGLLNGKGRAARIGGEEFVIWMPRVDLAGARAHAESLRAEFAQLRLADLADDITLTASFGVAAFGPHTPLRMVCAQADAALYCAKASGRNCVVVHGDSENEERAVQNGSERVAA